MPAHNASKTRVERAGIAGIHVLLSGARPQRKTWMAGTSPAMTWRGGAKRPEFASLLNVDDGYDPMTPVDDHDLVADYEVEIAAPCRMIPDNHFGNRNDVDALGHYRSGCEREIDIADPRNAASFQHSLANARSLLAREGRIAAAAFLGHAALADLALASAALVHAFASSLTCPLAALLARLALRPLPGRGLPVTLSLALPVLLSLTLYAFPFSFAARAR
jgi:hypothetical protein